MQQPAEPQPGPSRGGAAIDPPPLDNLPDLPHLPARMASPREPVPVTPSFDSLSDSTPAVSNILKEIQHMQKRLLEFLTAERRTPHPLPPTEVRPPSPATPGLSVPPPPPPAWKKGRRPPRLRLPTFDGSGSIDRFLECYEGYAQAQQLTEQRKIDYLFAQLRGKAADRYAKAALTAPQTWQEVTTLLVKQFRPPDYAAQNIAALFHRKKTPDERLRKYWQDKLYICRCVDVNMPEPMQRVYLQRGLPAHLQYHMITMRSTPLPKVLGLLELMEAADLALAEDKKSLKPAYPPPSTSRSSQQPPTGHRGRRHRSSQVSGHNKPYSSSNVSSQTSSSPSTMGPLADGGGCTTPPPTTPAAPYLLHLLATWSLCLGVPSTTTFA